METEIFQLGALSVPCGCRCRYCLLSWDGHCPGPEYPVAEQVGRRFYQWFRENQPQIRFLFYFGFSMDTPYLRQNLAFSRETGSPAARFLQMDGLKFRTPAQAEDFFKMLKEEGVELVDFTFYGTEAYHDAFAGRKGDFAYMLSLSEIAHRQGLQVEMGAPVTRENLSQMEELVRTLEQKSPDRLFLFLPHELGKGACLAPCRLRVEDWESLPQGVKQYLNINRLKTPQEWKAVSGSIQPKKRLLNLMVTKENAEALMTRPVEDILRELEEQDNLYHATVPDFAGLCQLYAQPEDRRLFRQDDLQRAYEARFIAERGIVLPDLNNQRGDFSIRY